MGILASGRSLSFWLSGFECPRVAMPEAEPLGAGPRHSRSQLIGCLDQGGGSTATQEPADWYLSQGRGSRAAHRRQCLWGRATVLQEPADWVSLSLGAGLQGSRLCQRRSLWGRATTLQESRDWVFSLEGGASGLQDPMRERLGGGVRLRAWPRQNREPPGRGLARGRGLSEPSSRCRRGN